MSGMTPEIPAGAMNWKWMTALGVILILGGTLSILFPFLASLLVTGYAGAAFLVGGALQIWLAARAEDGTTGGRLLSGLLGALMIVFALSLFFDPLAGLVSLTILVAIFFLALGALRILVALRLRPRKRWRWMAASGGLSVILGLTILILLQVSAESILGILLGVELLMAGVAAVAMAMEARSAA